MKNFVTCQKDLHSFVKSIYYETIFCFDLKMATLKLQKV